MEVLTADLSRFDVLKDFNYKANFLEIDEARMHYIDEGDGEVMLALHGQPSWSYLYRKMISPLKDFRFIAPDLIGFGKSDKYADWKSYSFEKHLQSLEKLIDELQLNDINLLVQDWGGLLGLSLLGQHPDRFKRVFILNTFLPRGKSLPLGYKLWRMYSRYHPSIPVGKIIQRFTHSKLTDQVVKAYDLPFPSKKHKAGVKAFPSLVPSSAEDPSVPYLLQARKVLENWNKPCLVMFSDKDPVFSGLEDFFLKRIPSCKNQPKIVIKDAGHFLQEEKGEEIANYIKLFVEGKIALTHQ